MSEQYTEVIQKFGLDSYFKTLLQDNRAWNAPYHNVYHAMCVFKNCYNIATDFERLPLPEVKELLIAALFHDFNHSQGRDIDEVNVDRAKKYYLSIAKEDQHTKDKVCQLIDATQYPYVKENDLTIQEKIIRDADMLQLFEDNYLQQVVFGYLMKELGLTMKEAINTQLKFMDNIQFYTPVAKELALEFLPERKQMMQYLKKLLNA